MSWEVLTMRSATSFFNPALARSDLRRYWPALFLYVGLWIIFLPVQLWLMAHQGYVPAPDLGEICSDRYIAAVIMALIFGGMMAMASFSYLMNPRSVGAMHALPQRRGTLFWTHFLTGWGMLAAGNLLVALLTAGIALLTGVKLTAALLTWLVVVTLLDLFFMALGTFCAMITGWLLAVPVLYGVANTLALIVTWLEQQLADGLLLGYAPPGRLASPDRMADAGVPAEPGAGPDPGEVLQHILSSQCGLSQRSGPQRLAGGAGICRCGSGAAGSVPAAVCPAEK